MAWLSLHGIATLPSSVGSSRPVAVSPAMCKDARGVASKNDKNAEFTEGLRWLARHECTWAARF